MNNTIAKIMYVEDDKTLSYITTENLERIGYEVTCFDNGKEALQHYGANKYDICLCDVMMPYVDGFKLVQHIRAMDKNTPIIFLTAKSMLDDKLHGLTIGADDYLTKPYSLEELILKINVFLKRSNKRIPNTTQNIRLGQYQYCDSTLVLKGPQFEKRLTQREAELLKLFLSNTNQLLTRDTILNTIWKDNDYFLGRSMDVFISRLRKYLKNDPQLKIKTVHGYGFVMSIAS